MIHIDYYTKDTRCDNPWKDSLFSSDSQLVGLYTRDLITFGRQPILQQHRATYLTGKDTCHAHHLAKMLATALLNGTYPQAPSLQVTPADDTPATVLWIDTLHGPHACAEFFREMTTGLDPDKKQFHLLCLDVIGGNRDNFWEVTRRIDFYIKDIKPTLVVIDDIDNLMPYCGVTVASEFNRVIRDIINHSETSFLFIGYNHLNKRASTTGNLGKFLFSMSSNVFSVTTTQAVTHVRLVRSRDMRFAGELQDDFHFTIGSDNLPQQVIKAMPSEVLSPNSDYIEQNTLHDIMTQVITPGEDISPDDLTNQVAARRVHLNRINHSRALIAQATRLGIITRNPDTNNYTLTTQDPPQSTNTPFNIPLTLPPHPQSPPINNK